MYINLTLWKIVNILYFYSLLTNTILSYRINNVNLSNFNTFLKKDVNTFLNGSKSNKIKPFELLNSERNQLVQEFKTHLENERNPAKQQSIRVRFAPSPTGLLHTGSLRTYIYNYMFAKNKGGTLVLRIDDTDDIRNVPETMDDIISNLRWSGLDWDEGVYKSEDGDNYYQSKRHHLYRQYADVLLHSRHAYRCFCKDSLVKRLLKKLFNINLSNNCNKCYNMNNDDVQSMLNKNKKYTIKLRSNTEDFDDFVLIRSNGTATYNFSSTVDDMLMRITHVIRGADHVLNTNKQRAIFDAFKVKSPEFIHVPLLTDDNQAKLSKRSGGNDYTVKQLRLDGICSLPLVNYLTFLGTKYTDQKRILNVKELVNVFSFDILSNLPISFDYKKLLNLNRKYINSIDGKTLLKEVKEFLEYYLYNKEGSSNRGSNSSSTDKTSTTTKSKDEENENNEDLEDKLYEEDRRFLYVDLLDVYKNRISNLKEYFYNVKQSLKYNYDNIKSKPKDEYNIYFKFWLMNELEWILKQSTNSIDLHINFNNMLVELSSSEDMKEHMKSLRFLMTGEEKGPSMMDMAKTWKIVQDLNISNFVNLQQRLVNVKNILS